MYHFFVYVALVLTSTWLAVNNSNMVDDGMMLMGQCFLKTGFSFSSLSQTHLSCKPGVLNLFRLGTTFTAAYKLAGDKAINKDNLLKLLSNLLKMLLMYYYKHIHILLNNFH